MKAYLESNCGTYLVTLDDGRDVFVQRDVDFVPLARALGFNLRRRGERCRHRHTDGTIPCPNCGKNTRSFISEATDFLNARIGKLRLSRAAAEDLDQMAGNTEDEHYDGY